MKISKPAMKHIKNNTGIKEDEIYKKLNKPKLFTEQYLN